MKFIEPFQKLMDPIGIIKIVFGAIPKLKEYYEAFQSLLNQGESLFVNNFLGIIFSEKGILAALGLKSITINVNIGLTPNAVLNFIDHSTIILGWFAQLIVNFFRPFIEGECESRSALSGLASFWSIVGMLISIIAIAAQYLDKRLPEFGGSKAILYLGIETVGVIVMFATSLFGGAIDSSGLVFLLNIGAWIWTLFFGILTLKQFLPTAHKQPAFIAVTVPLGAILELLGTTVALIDFLWDKSGFSHNP